MTPDPDLLGDEPVRRRPLGWLWVPVLLLLVAGGLAVHVDHRLREQERASLDSCQRRLEQASVLSDLRLGGLSHYLTPVVSTAPRPQQLHLADLMSGPAQRVLPEVLRADRVCSRVSVRPWHFALEARRSALTGYSGALVTLVQTIASQGRSFLPADVALVRLRRAAGVSDGPG